MTATRPLIASRRGGSLRRVMMPGFDVRIAGFPVRIEATFFLTAAILGQGRPGDLVLAWIAVVSVSILVHELGHAFAFRAFGDAPRITLHTLGGLTHPTKELPFAKEIVAAAAGALTGLLVLGLPAYAIREAIDPLAAGDVTLWVVLSDVVWANVGWSVVNLLPVLPLDGGLIARRVLGRVLGRRGGAAALVVSIVTAGVGVAIATAARSPYLGFFAFFFVVRDAAELWRKRDDEHRDRIREARRLLEEGDRHRGADLLRGSVSGARTSAVRREAAAALVWSLLEDGRFSEARQIVDGAASDAENAELVHGVLTAVEGRVDDGGHLVASWWLSHPTYALGVPVAAHLARTGAVPAIVDDVLAAEGEEGAVLAARLQYELHVAAHYRTSAEVGRRLFEDPRAPAAGAAYNVACSLSRDGHLGLALDWLDRAVESGWTDGRQILSDEDLVSLKGLPRFGVILSRIRDPPAHPRG